MNTQTNENNMETIKTTAKEYKAKSEIKSELKNQAQNFKFAGEYDKYHQVQVEVKKIEDEYFNLLPVVNVSFYIGSRSYFEEAVKIGKQYFKHGKAMTKGRGYWNIEEIAEITDEMSNSMMADSYYY